VAAAADRLWRLLQPHLADALADPESRARLGRLCASLPATCPGVLEVRLAPPSRQVDLSFCVRHPEAARQIAAVVANPVIRRFLGRWADGELPQVPTVWIEFDLDLDLASDGVPTPTLIAKLREGVEPGWVVGELLPALRGEPLAAGVASRAARCLAELEAPGRLLYAFALHPRPGRPLRLELGDLEPAAMVRYAARVAPAISPFLAELMPLFAGIGCLYFSLDLPLTAGEQIAPRVGIEGSFAGLPDRQPRWAALFEKLVASGLCAPERRDAVLAWPGWDSFWTAPDDWPVEEAGLSGTCARGLSHVKIVVHPGRPVEAKAYLAFNWVRPQPAADPEPSTAALHPGA
jgi:hypothetical protein